MLLSKLLDALPRKTVIGSPHSKIRTIVHDSRYVEPGDVFVAIREPSGKDGHRYVKDAVARGASTVVQDRTESFNQATNVIVPDTSRALGYMAAEYYGHPANDLRLIGVTGTNGKPTVSVMIEAILRESGKTVGGLGTMGSRFMGRTLDAKLKHTTPYPMELHSTLRKIRDQGAKYAVMEVSSHSLAWQRLSGFGFVAGVLTNLTRDHLDDHKTFDAYREAKIRLFSEYLSTDGCSILNLDDPAFKHFEAASRAPIRSYGIDKMADVTRVGPISFFTDRTSFKVQARSGSPFRICTPLLGRFNVYNALAAISAGLEFEIDSEIIHRALSGVKVPGRLERIDCGQPFNVLVDFAHTPSALTSVLTTCREWTGNKLIVVFGCGGDRDPGKRSLMGRAATSFADMVVVTSDNPRTEPPDQIIRDIETGLQPNVATYIVQDRNEAIQTALMKAGAGDTVLIAGMGDTGYQFVGDSQIEFDDRVKARNYLQVHYG